MGSDITSGKFTALGLIPSRWPSFSAYYMLYLRIHGFSCHFGPGPNSSKIISHHPHLNIEEESPGSGPTLIP